MAMPSEYEGGYGFLDCAAGIGGPHDPAGFLLAVPALRLKGDYLAIVTLGFGEIVRLVFNNWDSFTRGPNGISGIAPPISWDIVGKISYYYFLSFFS